MIEPLLPIAVLSCLISLAAGVAIGRATVPHASGFYARR
jgi:hypothetical protein